MSQKKRKGEDNRSGKSRQRKPDKSWKRKDEVPESYLDAELQDMMLRINRQLRCSCGAIYADVLEKCNSCGKPNPLNT